MKFRLMAVGAACTALVLSACDKPEEQPKAAAGGELLPRSASDDMLPYDTVRSQASLSAPDAGLFEDIPHSRRPDVSASAAAEEDVVTDPVVPDVAAPVAPTQ